MRLAILNTFILMLAIFTSANLAKAQSAEYIEASGETFRNPTFTNTGNNPGNPNAPGYFPTSSTAAPTASPRPTARPSGGGGSGSAPASSAASEEEGGENEVPQAIKDYVLPTNTFSMGGLCVGNSCGLEVGTGSPNDVIWRGIRIIASIAGTFAILLYIVGAFFLISSQGDENQLNKGKTIVIYTSLGLILVFGAYIIVQFVLALIFSN